MKKQCNISFLILGLAVALLAASATGRADAFEDANRAFAAGQFAASARGYESVLKRDGYSAAVLFNLGNADLRMGQTGDAILNFERAKWLAPHDPDINANLRFARQQAGLATSPASWSEALAGLFSPNDWAWLATGSLVVLCAGILLRQSQAKYRGGLYLLNAASAIVLFVSAAAVAVRYQQLDRAILPAKVTDGLISPFTGAKTMAVFPAGQTVVVERSHGGFRFVRDQAGHSGWVNSGQVALVVPGSW